jgi:hypothetical protein
MRELFLKIIYEIKQAGVRKVWYLDEIWVTENNAHTSYWKMNDGSDGLKKHLSCWISKQRVSFWK